MWASRLRSTTSLRLPRHTTANHHTTPGPPHLTDAGVRSFTLFTMTDTLITFAWIAAAGLLAPVLSFATSKKVPAVVFLIILGVLIGP